MTENHNNEHQHFDAEEALVVDAEHVEDSTPFDNEAMGHDTIEGTESSAASSDQIGPALRKAAQDTAYAAVGFVGLVSDKAKEFYEDQKKQYAEAHPEADAEFGAKNFLAQLKEQLDKLIEDVNRGFRDLADRGRTSGKTMADDVADAAENAADDLGDAADRAADHVSDAAQRAADHVEDFAEGV
ncbi:MAG: hypothetical protein Q4G35_01830, partial [Propionibacteriaceae bacterium]|nr:hypothetical protein [Propionibacteriaceae bacterium]